MSMVDELNKLLNEYPYGIVTYNDIIISDDLVREVNNIDSIITILLITSLIKDEKIHLDDMVNKYLKGFSAELKLIHLLTHSSGITDSETIFSVGTNAEYNNYNIELLDKIIEKVSGNSKAYCAEKLLFKPLNMVNTEYKNNKLYTTIHDITNIIYMILHNGYYNCKTIFETKYVDTWFTPLFINDNDIRRTIGFIYSQSLFKDISVVGNDSLVDDNLIFFIDRTNDYGWIILGDKSQQLISDIYNILRKYDKVI